MKVYLEDPEYIGVHLDDGTHVSRWGVVDDGEAERDLLEKHLKMIISEAVAAKNWEISKLRFSLRRWCMQHGKALCPGGSPDTYEQGMLEAKDQIRLILRSQGII